MANANGRRWGQPAPAVVDLGENGQPVTPEYRRLGVGSVSGDDEGMYVRFEPGFGLNVVIGRRWNETWSHAAVRGIRDEELCSMSIKGWEALCLLVEQYRERQEDREYYGD